jgi:hypothetical protein
VQILRTNEKKKREEGVGVNQFDEKNKGNTSNTMGVFGKKKKKTFWTSILIS